MNKHRVDMFGCLETRVKEHKAPQIRRKIAPGWLNAHNYSGGDSNGRIWILWKDHLKVQIIKVHKQYIHCLVEDPRVQIRLYVTIVYAKNDLKRREILWQDIMQITLQQQLHWVVCGDFNSVLNSEDRLGSLVTQEET